MTNQEVFNKVWKHFVWLKNKPAINSEGACRYKTEDGRKCAFGIFIPDEKYRNCVEGTRVSSAIVGCDLQDKFPISQTDFLSKVQTCHDKAATYGGKVYAHGEFLIRVETNLVNLAAEYELEVPKLPKAHYPSKQRLFNKVWKHLIINNASKSMLPNGNQCAYRGVKGAKCAIGCIIPDDYYSPVMEANEKFGGSISFTLKHFPILKQFLGADVLFLQRLQSAHDHYTNVEARMTYLKEVATQYQLTIPSPY